MSARWGWALLVAAVASAAVLAQESPANQRARALLEQLVAIDTTDEHGDTTAAARAMADRFRAAGFPADDVQVLGPNPRKGNLVVRLRGSGARRPLLLLAHLDVVEAKRDDWSVDPFALTEKNGYFYGRGTTDDKGMASQFVANLIRLKEEGFRAERDIIVALTADEEGGDFNGVQWLLETHRPAIDAELAINEGGSGLAKGGKYLVNEIQAAEKIYQDFRLEVHNPGGHSSLPVKDNAITHLSAALTRIGGFEFPIRLNEITRTYFARSAAVQSDDRLAADMRAVGAAPSGERAAARLASSSPLFNAMMRTTCVATRLDGGHANNALPQTAGAVVNCRLLPGESPDDIRQKLVSIVADASVDVRFIDRAQESQPAAMRPDVLAAVESITRSLYPGAVVVPVMSTGATDGLFLRNAGIPTFGIEATFIDMDDIRAHGRDERVGVKQFYEGLEFHYRLTKALAAPGRTP
jgi:acetylornithine deacetylase/succinyl-diaminopimelate desuccinylase-like protein